jgi:hypothetical protein
VATKRTPAKGETPREEETKLFAQAAGWDRRRYEEGIRDIRRRAAMRHVAPIAQPKKNQSGIPVRASAGCERRCHVPPAPEGDPDADADADGGRRGPRLRPRRSRRCNFGLWG